MSSIFVLGRTSRDVWMKRAQLSARRPFLHFKDRSWTYGEADIEIRRLAAGLRRLGLAQGMRVLVGMSNRAETLFVHFAVRHLGAVVVGMVPGSSFDELAYQIEHTGAHWLIADDPIASLIGARQHAFPLLRRLIVCGPTAAEPTSDYIRFETLYEERPIGDVVLDNYDDLSPAEILYTSGSTSKPKGAIAPAGALITSGFGYADRFEVGADDHFLLPFTFAHGTGAWLAPGIVLKEGGQLTILERMNPSLFWDQVKASGATVVLLFPAQINLIMNEPNAPAKGASSLRLVITHEWIPEFWEKFGIPMLTTWGSTETGATGAGAVPIFRGDRETGYLGKPYAEAEIAAFSPDGRRLPSGNQGELRVKHRHIMLGYLNEPEITASTIVDGWVCSGDLGVVDETGDVYYRGRIKTMIKRSGENISPGEVEAAINQHPAVYESVVFGVPDPIRKEEVAAVISLTADAKCSETDLMQFLATRISKAKLPRFVELIDAPLPRLSVGKIDRPAVIKRFGPATFWDARASKDKSGASVAKS